MVRSSVFVVCKADFVACKHLDLRSVVGGIIKVDGAEVVVVIVVVRRFFESVHSHNSLVLACALDQKLRERGRIAENTVD